MVLLVSLLRSRRHRSSSGGRRRSSGRFFLHVFLFLLVLDQHAWSFGRSRSAAHLDTSSTSRRWRRRARRHPRSSERALASCSTCSTCCSSSSSSSQTRLVRMCATINAPQCFSKLLNDDDCPSRRTLYCEDGRSRWTARETLPDDVTASPTATATWQTNTHKKNLQKKMRPFWLWKRPFRLSCEIKRISQN